MPKYKINIEYDGTDFVGWQKQENGISIQSSLEDAIYKLTNEDVTIFGAGRTDAGVHAKNQVAHFEIKKNLSLDNIRDGLNQYLKKLSISILKSEIVDENFNARFSAKLRVYQYKIKNRRPPLTFEKNLYWGVFKKLNINDMKKAIKYFIGKHDFNAFRSIDCQSSSSLKTINDCNIEAENENIFINISARSFLHSQVRIIVGTLVEVGKGNIKPEEIKEIILRKDRSRAGPTAPAQGLYLIKVEY
tara:strand:+ start:5321 stop:6058 length:738 start_codon:yes stop_codon:yes gene_type:complete